jgi:hypothetical protein
VRFLLTRNRPYRTVTFYKLHDEGYATGSYEWRADFETRVVELTVRTMSRDCDGRMSRVAEFECPFDDVRKLRFNSFRVPEWSDIYSVQRDYAAEAEGY